MTDSLDEKDQQSSATSTEAKDEPSMKKESSRSKQRRRQPKKARTASPTKPQRSFPRVTFVRAIRIAQKIKELNGGNPWPPEDVARALEVGASTGSFFYITASSRDFGLTVGTRDSERIELTPLGRAIVYAPDAESEKNKKIEAFFKVDVFRKVYEHYGSATLPDMKYLGNTLENQFSVIPAFHEEFVKLFCENCRDLGLDQPGATAGAVADGQVGRGPGTVVLAEARTTGKHRRAFIIMPFSERLDIRPKGFFDEVLRGLLTPAGVNAGFSVETAKRQGSDVIQSTIINELLDADLVIADLTDHNPNVLFELGLRMAEQKPVALVKTRDTGRIFDVDNMLRVFEYNPNLWPSTLATDLPTLTEHITAAWDARDNGQSYMKILRRGISDAGRLVG